MAAIGHADHVIDRTSRQARTQRPHWMQASRLTLIAGWLDRPASARRPESGFGHLDLSAQCQNFNRDRVRSRAPAGRRPAIPSPSSAPRPRAGCRLHLQPTLGVRCRGRQHALALDLDHAGTAIAVGPQVRLRRITECGILRLCRMATCHMVSPLMASTCWLSSSN